MLVTQLACLQMEKTGTHRVNSLPTANWLFGYKVRSSDSQFVVSLVITFLKKELCQDDYIELFQFIIDL